MRQSLLLDFDRRVWLQMPIMLQQYPGGMGTEPAASLNELCESDLVHV
jgi:hypothetical protein